MFCTLYTCEQRFLYSPERAVVFLRIGMQVCIKLVNVHSVTRHRHGCFQSPTTDYSSSSDSLHVPAGTSLGIAFMNYISRSRG
jgi:hypothetical protein